TTTRSRASRRRARGRPDWRCARWARPAILFSSNPRRERRLVSSQRPIPRPLHQKETSKIICSPPNRCRKRNKSNWFSPYGERGSVGYLLLLWRGDLGEGADRLDRAWHAAILRKMEDHLLELGVRDAEVERAAHVNSELRSASEREQRRHRDHRTSLDRESRTGPDAAEQFVVEELAEVGVEAA